MAANRTITPRNVRPTAAALTILYYLLPCYFLYWFIHDVKPISIVLNQITSIHCRASDFLCTLQLYESHKLPVLEVTHCFVHIKFIHILSIQSIHCLRYKHCWICIYSSGNVVYLMKQKTSTRKTVIMSEETYNRLMGFGRFKESFDDLLNNLMDKAQKNRSETK